MPPRQYELAFSEIVVDLFALNDLPALILLEPLSPPALLVLGEILIFPLVHHPDSL